MKKIEQRINSILQYFPSIRIRIKRAYQLVMYFISPKLKCEGNIKRITPVDDEYEYFFGYYDKSPWDATGRYMLCNRVKNAYLRPDNNDEAQLVLIDTRDNNRVSVIATTHTWNVQQGCMLQWLGPDYESRVIYNDFRNGKLCAIILNIRTREERELPMPVYSVAANGCFALTLDFFRLHRLRPGYGYCNLPDTTAEDNCPDKPCIWRMDLTTGSCVPLATYVDLASFEPSVSMNGAKHKVNHLMISPDGNRFMLLHRWFVGTRKYSRLITGSLEGGELYNLLDDGYVSHCYWKNESEIITFAEKKGYGRGYLLLKDKTTKCQRLWPFLIGDGHPSYAPDGRVVTDTYPDRHRIASIYVLSEQQTVAMPLAKVFTPFRYDNDVRCDLHPRWNRDGSQICFDGAFEGKRALYVIPKIDGGRECKRVRALVCLRRCVNKGPVHQTFNILNNIDFKRVEPVFLTIKKEDINDSIYAEFEGLKGVDIHFVEGTRRDLLLGIIFGRGKIIASIIAQKPDVIHTTGILVDLIGYRAAKRLKIRQIATIRNYVFDDYLKKFGNIRGTLVALIHWKMMKRLKSRCSFICCSKSLADKYNEANGIEMRYIRNGVDLKRFDPSRLSSKEECRKQLGIGADWFIFITVAQVIDRKNIGETIEAIPSEVNCKKAFFVLVGDGSGLKALKQKYVEAKNILFVGKQTNVEQWLRAADVFVSSSESEGLPNAVIEAMAMGVPVVLSDIPQHKEIIDLDNTVGYLYALHDVADLREKMMRFDTSSIRSMGESGRRLAAGVLSDCRMSTEYQELYWELGN